MCFADHDRILGTACNATASVNLKSRPKLSVCSKFALRGGNPKGWAARLHFQVPEMFSYTKEVWDAGGPRCSSEKSAHGVGPLSPRTSARSAHGANFLPFSRSFMIQI